MPRFDECCVLIPAVTLEDFPSDLSDFDARSLLAAWTVLWHPALLAETGQLPAWYRADSPPEDLGTRLFTVPVPSLAQLPDGFAQRARNTESCLWLEGGSREELVERLPLDELPAPVSERLHHGEREIEVADFFAAGYAWLQVQVMTRRLRYTSNIDELHLQGRAVAAATAFVKGDAETAIEALHDVFDTLAEERDHYFSSDPHLIDLVLTSRTTVDQLLELIDQTKVAAPIHPVSSTMTAAAEADADDASESDRDQAREEGVDDGAKDKLEDDGQPLPTPFNLLIDSDVAEALGHLEPSRTEDLRRRLADQEIGWAGGGPTDQACLDAMTYSQAESEFEHAYERTSKAVGMPPPVYGRFSGATPTDMTATLVRLGYRGMIPIDFAAGAGFGDEAKVLMQSAGAEIEALTAKPIDASSDASFLTLGTRLGEAIDSGEIATGLLAHWPQQTCTSFQDLRRVASWSLCLGRFWTLGRYFEDGEHPYHHGTSITSSPQSADSLAEAIEGGAANPITGPAELFRSAVSSEHTALLDGMAELVSNSSGSDQDGQADARFAQSIGCRLADGDANRAGATRLLINPHSIGCRCETKLAAGLPEKTGHLYAASMESGNASATVDVPACGFVLIDGSTAAKSSGGLGGRLRSKLMGGPKPIAERAHLQNEFMEVTLDEQTGGISGVYSGSVRGNRFSLRLIRNGRKDESTAMSCDRLSVISSTPSLGIVEATGTIRNEQEGLSEDPVLASFRIQYKLERGSRFLCVEGEIEPRKAVEGEPWTHYYAARAAVATEAPICRALVRDKLHRARSRRMVAPLGMVVDEADRQTLICSHGTAFHRRVGERFIDTLLIVQGESDGKFNLEYGFDVAAPVASARSRLAPPLQVSIAPNSTAPEIGWILHTSPKDILLSQFELTERDDGHLCGVVRIIQTQPQACKAKLRFFRDVHVAVLVDGSIDQMRKRSLKELEDDRSGRRDDLEFEGDSVSLSMRSHGIADLLVVFKRE